MSVICTKNLSRQYGGRRGIQDVNLQIGEGEIFGFLGPNGAGKTTTIRLLLGFLKPGSGSAAIFQRDCWSDSPEIKQYTGYVPGDVRLYPWLTTRKALRIVGKIRNQDLMPEGGRLAERFRLELDLPVRKMSRGNRQKVAIVLALAHRPRLAILDEPTSGLDPLMQDTLCQCLREMANEGRTVVFSSHTLSEVESLCDRVCMIRDGRIVVDESLESLKKRAPRQISVMLPDSAAAASISWPDFMKVKQIRGSFCHLEMVGPSPDFLRWAATQDFRDVTIGLPSLDVLFREFYDLSPSAESE